MRTDPDTDGSRVYIRGLPSTTSTALVSDLMAQYGSVFRVGLYEDAATKAHGMLTRFSRVSPAAQASATDEPSASAPNEEASGAAAAGANQTTAAAELLQALDGKLSSGTGDEGEAGGGKIFAIVDFSNVDSAVAAEASLHGVRISDLDPTANAHHVHGESAGSHDDQSSQLFVVRIPAIEEQQQRVWSLGAWGAGSFAMGHGCGGVHGRWWGKKGKKGWKKAWKAQKKMLKKQCKREKGMCKGKGIGKGFGMGWGKGKGKGFGKGKGKGKRFGNGKGFGEGVRDSIESGSDSDSSSSSGSDSDSDSDSGSDSDSSRGSSHSRSRFHSQGKKDGKKNDKKKHGKKHGKGKKYDRSRSRSHGHHRHRRPHHRHGHGHGHHHHGHHHGHDHGHDHRQHNFSERAPNAVAGNLHTHATTAPGEKEAATRQLQSLSARAVTEGDPWWGGKGGSQWHYENEDY